MMMNPQEYWGMTVSVYSSVVGSAPNKTQMGRLNRMISAVMTTLPTKLIRMPVRK